MCNVLKPLKTNVNSVIHPVNIRITFQLCQNKDFHVSMIHNMYLLSSITLRLRCYLKVSFTRIPCHLFRNFYHALFLDNNSITFGCDEAFSKYLKRKCFTSDSFYAAINTKYTVVFWCESDFITLDMQFFRILIVLYI